MPWLCLLMVMLSACSDAYEETGPEDILSSGRLCAPAESDCPSRITLHRSTEIGANQLDLRLENTGAAAEITVKATVESADVEDATDLDTRIFLPDNPQVNPAEVEPPDTITLVERTYQLRAGEVTYDRFVSRELLTVQRFQVSLSCEECTASLDYTLVSRGLECRNDDECGGTWACNRADGRCVECLQDSHCASGQNCNTSSQTCVPPKTGGCSTAPGNQSPTPSLLLAITLLGLLFALIRRRSLPKPEFSRSSYKFLGILALSSGFFCLLTQSPRHAQAAAPNAALQVGVGPRLLTGKLGADTKRGIGVNVSQHVRGRYLGAKISVGASYYLTTQEAPPLSNELQLYSIALGPNFYLPIEPVEIAVGADIRHVGLVTNSLARLTGPDLNYFAAGATAQVRYRFSGISIILDGGFHPLVGLGSSLLSLNISLGLETE